MARDAQTRTPNTALISLREAAGLSQQELADELNQLAARRFGKHPNITKKTAGRWERGEVEWPQPFHRRLLAEYFCCATNELGFRRPARDTPRQTIVSGKLLPVVPSPPVTDPRVEAEHQRWRAARAELGGHRRPLAVAAEQLYADARLTGLDSTGAIAPPNWIPSAPVPLGDVQLNLEESRPSRGSPVSSEKALLSAPCSRPTSGTAGTAMPFVTSLPPGCSKTAFAFGCWPLIGHARNFASA